MKKILISVMAFMLLCGFDWFKKPIMFTVPFAVGGPSDVLARHIEFAIETNSNVKVAVINQGGASGNIGMNSFSRQDKGLLLVTENIFVNKKYIPDSYPTGLIQSIEPVYFFGNSPYIIYANKRFISLQDLVNASKQRPILIGTAAPGSGSYETYNFLCNVKKILEKCTRVGYKGSGDALIDLMAGRIDVFNSLFPAYHSFIGTGDVVALATLSKTRPIFLSNVPTAAELGFAIENENWFGIFHKGLTANELASIHTSIDKYFTREKLNSLGFDMLNKTPREFWQYQQAVYKEY